MLAYKGEESTAIYCMAETVPRLAWHLDAPDQRDFLYLIVSH